MNIYVSSSGEEKDVREMADAYLNNALIKTERILGEHKDPDKADPVQLDNYDALKAEVARRKEMEA